LLLREAQKIVTAIGRMLSPFCEVVLHDLTNPAHSILAIECPISGRKVGDSTTEMGLARIADPAFPDVVQNYPNRFPDGRPAKSTSIGLRDGQGRFVAAICLNMDVSLFSSVQHILAQVTATALPAVGVAESLRTRSVEEIRARIDEYAGRHNIQPHALDRQQRRDLVRTLAEDGTLHLKGAAATVAQHLGVSRASIYNDLKNID
jgi:predicted transcriptional regulator YheO